jgi:hypothetical protein
MLVECACAGFFYYSLDSEYLITMTENSQNTQPPSQNEIDRAWRYHKNADTLFHSRLTSFVTSQSFLITGYMVSFVIPKEFLGWYSVSIRIIVARLGITYSILLFLVCDWLYKGMQRLKLKYLSGTTSAKRGDPIYQDYYFHPDPVRGFRDEGQIGKIIPRYLPLFTVGFWVLLVIVEIFRLV